MTNQFDAACLDMAITAARKSFEDGNYPVGAVLAIGNKVVGRGGNTGETSKNYSNHAETSLIIHNARALLQNSAEGLNITLYSTLEPCLMCLGTATMNKVNRIMYIQSDPYAGACSIDVKSLGERYQEVWPDIIHSKYSSEPKEMVLRFLARQIQDGKRVEWSKKFLKLIEPVQ